MTVPAFSIPTVDISPYLSDPSSSAAHDVVAQIRHACKTSGFFQIIGHGISRGLQAKMFSAAKLLFDLPLDEKDALRSIPGRGYETIGSQTLQPGMKPDMKEVSYEKLYSTMVRSTKLCYCRGFSWVLIYQMRSRHSGISNTRTSGPRKH